VARRNQENRIGKVCRHRQRGVLKLETVPQHHIVALAGIVAERVFERRRIFVQLDIADIGVEFPFDAQERVVGDPVPALLGDAARHEQAHLEAFRKRGSSSAGQGRAGQGRQTDPPR
jgi:hypothetical protein